MRLFLIFHGRFPSEKAASLFAAKSAEAFREVGEDVVVLAPRRLGRTTSARAYYRLKSEIPVVYLATLDLLGMPVFKKIAFYISYIWFSWSVLIYLALHSRKGDRAYSNESLPLFAASFFLPAFYELHDYPERFHALYRFFFDRVARIIITNEWKRNKLAKDFPEVLDRTRVEQNAVDLAEIPAMSRAEARAAVGENSAGALVVYTGHLYAWKGVNVLAAAAESLDATVVFVGGTDEDSARFRARWGRVPNIRILGNRPHHEALLWQKAADVLVLPNTAEENISAAYTSPMKLFEYLASGTPVVASDLPSVREIADASRAILVTPDSPESLRDGIRRALAGEGESRARAGRTWVEDHTWHKRAERIVRFLN